MEDKWFGPRPPRWFVAGLLFGLYFLRRDPQSVGSRPHHGKGKASRQPQPGAQGAQARAQPSAEYNESLRRTVEKRRERRALRRQGLNDSRSAVGAIVPWPMPPALIIRHTSEVHDEIGAFLFGLRH